MQDKPMDKKTLMFEASAHGKARDAKVRKIMEMGVERFKKMHVFHIKRANPNRCDAEQYYHFFQFLQLIVEPEVTRLRENLLKNLKEYEEVIIPDHDVVIRKECGEIVFDKIKTDTQWQTALREYHEENRG